MAEALLTIMFENLNSLIQKGFGLLWGVNKEMEKLSSILSTIRAVLEDAEEKQLRNRAIKNWLQKLKDVSGELDDILDECSMEASLLEYKTQRFGSTQKVKASFLSCLNPKNTWFRFQIAKKMEDVSERLDDIAKEREKFHLREVVQDQRRVQVRNERDTGSIVDEKQDECTVTKSDFPDFFFTFCNGKSLRTLLLMEISSFMAQAKLPHRLYFPSLRAFDIEDAFILKLKSISSLISNSKHLRYLNLSRTNIRILPESICLLVNLQTLDVSGCYNLEKLPKHMSRLRGLRHFYIEGCHSLNHMPPNIGKLSCLRSLSRFIVDRRRGCDIDELGSLLKLGGSLRIEHLEKVKSPMEAKKANLVGKTNLQRLHLRWPDYLNEKGDQKMNHEKILDALEPPPTLKDLYISNFRGGHFPHWLNANLENLVSINFSYCRNCMELPTAMGKLPSLTSLCLSAMECLRYVDNESCDGRLFGGFFRLETLVIDCLRSLERLSRVERSDIFPRLSNLRIVGCPKLTSLHSLPSIEELYLWGCNETLLESVSNLHTLTLLKIFNNDDLASFPDGFLHNLTALKSLDISRFRKLQDLPSDMLIDLTALEEISISRCDMLECFPTAIFQGLISLKKIGIEKCRRLKSLSDSFEDLTALESLQIQGCPKLDTFPNGLNNLSSLQRLTLVDLAALPENLNHLPSLKDMEISGFRNLEKLPDWLGDLTSLESLSIVNCRHLEYLPKCFQHLTNLQSLKIENCPKLTERCKKEIGEDWHKIAHIPHLLTATLENIKSLIQKEFGLLWGVNWEMKKLSSILLAICVVFKDAKERQRRDRAIKHWLQMLKDVADELDDFLDGGSIET
ncbi:hypothetical protein FEM48_Zijuj11G0147500 [Ziziphus jujuba var. spinosa]|uniref:Rx N-terminal domain-containing protein n=1 Tax=Ziziphus jujuba var. spinosa TaxID=714518 RepID=A0A978UJJ6_ZIZJJ|nr:hypothetical protein FEM48_Zijuj11G0147500 [Ziziphus jujuba var. spinosa]